MEKDTNAPSGRLASIFKKAIAKARTTLTDPDKVEALINTSKEKIKQLRSESKELDALIIKLGTSLRMIKAFKAKQYTQIPWKSILMITGGVIYFVMPIDLIPDFIPVLGLVDDATVMVWIFNSLRKDIEAFEQWEQKNRS